MGLFDKIFGPSTTDEEYYALVSEEISSGQIRPGLWAKALANCEYDETKAKAIYLKMRVKTLKEELKQAENAAFAELNLANKQGDGKRARELALPLARTGNPYGIYCQGCFLLEDAGNSKQAEEAIALLVSVAKTYPDAHFKIGRAFCYGQNFCKKNGDMAFKYFSAGAQAKSANCQFELGLMFIRVNDWSNAKKWLGAAKNQGHNGASIKFNEYNLHDD